MAVVLAYPGFWQKEPEYGIDWKRVLHAEQSVVFHAPLPVEGEVRSELTIDHIVDKGADKGALLYSTRKISDAATGRSEEHTSELQSLMRISYAVFCFNITANTEIYTY